MQWRASVHCGLRSTLGAQAKPLKQAKKGPKEYDEDELAFLEKKRQEAKVCNRGAERRQGLPPSSPPRHGLALVAWPVRPRSRALQGLPARCVAAPELLASSHQPYAVAQSQRGPLLPRTSLRSSKRLARRAPSVARGCPILARSEVPLALRERALLCSWRRTYPAAWLNTEAE